MCETNSNINYENTEKTNQDDKKYIEILLSGSLPALQPTAGKAEI